MGFNSIPLGADLGRYLIDCQQTDQFNDAELISDEEMRHFIEAYRGERARLAGSHFELDPANSTEHLLREAKILSFLAYMIDIIFCVRMASSQPDKRSQFLVRSGCVLEVKLIRVLAFSLSPDQGRPSLWWAAQDKSQIPR